MSPSLRAEDFNHSSIPVNDIERSRKFYVDLLGMNLMPRPGGAMPLPSGYKDALPGLLGVPDTAHLRLQCGNTEVTLFQRPKPVQRKSTEENGWFHYSYRMDYTQLDALSRDIARLRQEGYDIPFEPIRMEMGSDLIIRLYMFDPDGHLLELVGLGKTG